MDEENQGEEAKEEDKGAGMGGGGEDEGASKKPPSSGAGGGPEGAQTPMQGQAGEAGRKGQQKRQQRKAEPNPLRSLGDALERWRADLSVAHDAPNQDEDEEAAPMLQEEGEDAGQRDGQNQFLGADQKGRQGDTQALAPATEDQAKSLQGRNIYQSDTISSLTT